MSKLIVGLGVLVAGAFVILSSAVYTVNEVNQALVLEFGRPVGEPVTNPGLHFKMPFVQSVVKLDKRSLPFDAPAQEFNLSDQRRLVVDAFARFRIDDPLLFYQAVRTEGQARTRLGGVLESAAREVFGRVTSTEILSGERIGLMNSIRDTVNLEAQKFGIEVVDVRIKRADLPQANLESVYNRIRTDRQREAVEERSSGQQTKAEIEAEADRQQRVLLAEANRDAEILRGEGEAEALQIINEALSRNPEFYSFYRSLEAYRTALADGQTSIVLSPDSQFFNFFKDQSGAGNGSPVVN